MLFAEALSDVSTGWFWIFFFFLVFTCSGSNQQLCHMFDGGSGWLLPGYKLLQNEILTSEQVVAI